MKEIDKKSPWNVARRLPGASLLLTVAAVICSLVPGITEELQYERSAIAVGQLWRCVTCHLTHWSPDHLLWDAAALFVLGTLCEAECRARFRLCLFTSAILIPLAVWICHPAMQTYRGLSGIDSALFSLLAIQTIRMSWAEHQWPLLAGTVVFSAAFAAKVAFELGTGQTLFVDAVSSNMVPVPSVHIIGGLVGLTTAIAPLRPLEPVSKHLVASIH